MSYTYSQQKKKNRKPSNPEPLSGGMMESALPNSAQLETPGHRVDMPVVMREKMEGAFGMDLTAVKLYENKAVGEAGAEAVTQGSKIAFAPGKLDFSSLHGQALLGHEISHVASQAKGEVKGSGLVNDSALEARADCEGLMAARGESITQGYGGAAAPLSSSSAASAAGPMQAKSGKKKREEEALREKARADYESAQLNSSNSDAIKDDLFDIDMSDDRDAKVDKLFQLSAAMMMQEYEYDQAHKKKTQELIPDVYKEAQQNTNEYGHNDEHSIKLEAKKLAGEKAKTLLNEDDYNYISDEEKKWLQKMWRKPQLDVIREVNRRQNQLGEEMYKQRQKSGAERPDEDKGKLDLETAYSPAGLNYNVYNFIMSASWDDRIATQLKKEYSKKNNTEEQREMQDRAREIAYNGVNESTNPYLETPEGSDLQDKLRKENLKRLGILSDKHKHWKKQ